MNAEKAEYIAGLKMVQTVHEAGEMAWYTNCENMRVRLESQNPCERHMGCSVAPASEGRDEHPWSKLAARLVTATISVFD